MSKLKLFVSHSSRLDDVDDHGLPLQHNWELLQQTCTAIEDAYGDAIEILVDQDEQGLYPGVDWEQRLNQWIADCHAAIVLFSKRALDTSKWVKKEATILSWRREVEDDFTLIPVLLEGQSAIEDLQKDIWQILKIDKSQCYQAATGPDDVLRAVKLGLGEPAALRVKWHKTPFDRLEAVVSRILAEANTESLEEAWESLEEIKDKPPYHPERNIRFSVALTQYLFRDGEKCLSAFERVLDKLHPTLNRDRATELFKYLRALWVDPAAARFIPEARKARRCVAMTGSYVTDFTLERYIERAIPMTNRYKIISVTSTESLERILEQIRDHFRSKTRAEPMQAVDGRIKGYQTPIYLSTPAGQDAGRGLIDDDDTRRALSGLYPNVTLVMETGEILPEDLPQDIAKMEPSISLDYEKKRFDAEFEAEDFLDRYCS